MEELRAALAAALGGHGQLVLLAGEPGIGKTRTAAELVSCARRRGAQPLIGRCHEGIGAPPYWPWVQIVRAHVAGRAPDVLKAEMGAGAADIARVLPQVRERLPDLPRPPTLEPQHERFRFFDSFAYFLTRIIHERPCIGPRIGVA